MTVDEVKHVARQYNTRYVKVVLNDNVQILGTLSYSHTDPEVLDLLEYSVHKKVNVADVRSLEPYDL